MLKKIAIGVIVAAAVIIVVFFFMMKGPDLSKYEPLREPKITTMKDQKMVVVESKGDPNVVGSKAFGLLFKAYYKIEGTAKGPKQSAPRARWAGDMKDKNTWTGWYAMPVPDNVAALPALKADPCCKVGLETWEYGTVAEILHIGPYAEETPTIEKLMQFIKKSGYRIIGHHEEEYIKGPGMFFRGNPEKYYTIVRYRVKKRI